MRFFILCIVFLARTSASEAPRPAKPAAAIRVDVNLVLVPVMVTDSKGRNVLGLTSDNFRIYDGNLPRPIVAFSREDASVSAGLIFDSSHSMLDKFRVARQAPAALFAQLNPQDEAFLITVSDSATLRHDFTSDFEDLQNALLFTNPSGSTSLLDGVYMGLQKLKRAHNPRKALIVVSDGGDNNSRYHLHELQQLAVESDTQIYAICISHDPKTVEERDGPSLLEKLAVATGGVRFLMPDTSHMQEAMARIGVSLHNEYVLGIQPPPGAPQGKVRPIKVQLMAPVGTPQLAIYARSHYLVP
jgi:Ca-activated chloride channel homolog